MERRAGHPLTHLRVTDACRKTVVRPRAPLTTCCGVEFNQRFRKSFLPLRMPTAISGVQKQDRSPMDLPTALLA
jgi:hypothetical protein